MLLTNDHYWYQHCISSTITPACMVLHHSYQSLLRVSRCGPMPTITATTATLRMPTMYGEQTTKARDNGKMVFALQYCASLSRRFLSSSWSLLASFNVTPWMVLFSNSISAAFLFGNGTMWTHSDQWLLHISLCDCHSSSFSIFPLERNTSH